MTSIPPSIPFHLARAYNARPAVASPVAPAPVQASTPSAARGPREGVDPPAGAARLVAARVGGRIDFSVGGPGDGQAALPFYRHPADRHAAATTIEIGGSLDLNA